MGMHATAIDVHPEKLALASKLGAEITINGREADPVAELQKRIGGVHGVLVTAVAPAAFDQASGSCVRMGPWP